MLLLQFRYTEYFEFCICVCSNGESILIKFQLYIEERDENRTQHTSPTLCLKQWPFLYISRHPIVQSGLCRGCLTQSVYVMADVYNMFTVFPFHYYVKCILFLYTCILHLKLKAKFRIK